MPVIEGKLPKWMQNGETLIVSAPKPQAPSEKNSTEPIEKPPTKPQDPHAVETPTSTPALANELANALLAGLAQENANPDAEDERFAAQAAAITDEDCSLGPDPDPVEDEYEDDDDLRQSGR